MIKEKIVFCWSGGKDSALALNRVLRDERYEVVSLLTTCNEHFQRVSMHGVRVELLDRQAASIGLPLEKNFVGQRSSNEEYQQKMSACLLAHQARGVIGCAFGDIFLEDLKRWREDNLASIGMRGVFPIWKEDTHELMREFFRLGFGTITSAVSTTPIWTKPPWDGTLTKNSSARCRQTWTRAARTASFIPSPLRDRFSRSRSTSKWEKKCIDRSR